MRLKILVVASVLEILAASIASAQTAETSKAAVGKLKPADFPTRPIELTIANPAGGGMDVNGRFFAKYFEKYLGQSVIVNNRAGAGGFVGYQWLATQAPNDGTVVGFVGSSILADSMLRADGKWSYKDIDPIAFVNYEPVIWLTSTTGAYKNMSLKEITQIAKEKPETIRVAVAANSLFEMLAEQIELVTGAKFIKVPFGGDQPARQALLGNLIDVAFGFAGSSKGDVEGGSLKMIGVAGESRLPEFKDVPTISEALNTQGVVWISWRYAGVPKGMAVERKQYLVAAATAAAADPDLIAEFKGLNAITDKQLAGPEATASELDRLALVERQFYVRSGRVK